jgi:transposase
MIDYETYCKIKDCHERQHLTIAQTARALDLHADTVTKWVQRAQYRARHSVPRRSQLDPFKARVVRLLETHPYSAQQIFQRLREEGFAGGFTIVKDYVRKVRPARREAFLKLSFAPGECAQVDWGEYGSIGCGSTRRRLSFFVMVLCHSRLMYVEFTVSQTMEHFLAAHEHAFAAFGGVPSRVMIDNLKSAVLRRVVGEAPVFNPHYVDFARHWGFAISPCNVAKGNEKGRVENGVGYVKKNLLNGADFIDFSAVNPAAQVWLATIANVRIHGETHQRPVDLFKEEQSLLRALNPMPYDIGRITSQRASKQFRVAVDTNQYSLPAEYASQRVTLKIYPDRICIYFQDKLVARQVRHYDRHKDYEDPDHPRALLAQRHTAREQRLLQKFLSLSRYAPAYVEGIEQRRVNPRHHLRKIVALSEIYGVDAVDRAIQDGIAFAAYSCEYIANMLEMRTRETPEPAALHLTRRQDLLEIEIPPPDLSLYEGHGDDDQSPNH